METSPQSSRVVLISLAAVAAIGVAVVAGVLFFRPEPPVMDSATDSATVAGRAESSPDRLWQPDGRTRGHPNAPVTLIEYSDFTCGYCAKFFRETWPRLREKYVDTGKVRLLYRDYPRDPDGPAMTAAIAARCAGDQGRYWDMHDRLYGSAIDIDRLKDYATTVGLDQPTFAKCLRDAPHRQAILQDKKDGLQVGFVGTPGFILLRTDRAGKDKPIGLPGAFPVDVFEEEIDRLLKMSDAKKRS